jgi:imidazolonepropionase-like amidohydrolase
MGCSYGDNTKYCQGVHKDLGTLELGKLVDLLILDSNPLGECWQLPQDQLGDERGQHS